MAFHGEWLQETLYGSPTLQFLASVVVLATLVLLFRLGQSLRDTLSDTYTRNFAEGVETVVLTVGVVGGALLLADIWAVSFIVDQAVEGVTVDRWTSIRSTITIALLVSGYLVIRGVNRSLDRLRNEGAITDHQKEMAYHILDVGIFAVISLMILSVWGIALDRIVLGASVVTAVLGLAAQRTVAAVIAGFVLLFARPFQAGDWIEVGGEDSVSGIVQDVTISHTKIRAFSDEHVLIPNDDLTANHLMNYSRSNRLRIDIEIGVDYATDLDHARTVVKEAIEDLDIVSDIKRPKVVLKRFGDSSVVLGLQFWIENPARRRAWRAQTDAITAVKAAFEREGITIPFPQRTHSPRSGSGFNVRAPGGTGQEAVDHQPGTETGVEED